MSRLQNAVSIVRSLVGSFAASPRATFEAMRMVPAFAQGIEFERQFAGPRPAAAPELKASINPLTTYFENHLTGPGLWKWSHYFDIYHRHFQKFIGQPVHILEVGIYSGGSLGMWRSYFGEKCHIYGMDIEPACKAYEAKGIEVIIGDQSDRAFWSDFRKTAPKIDIVVDDGSHDAEHQRITFEELIGHIQPGGVYLCEDIGSDHNRFGGFTAGLTYELNSAVKESEGFDKPVIPSPFQASVKSITHYPYVTVVEKREADPVRFISRRQGTEWQPY